MVITPPQATLADLENTPDDGRRYEIIDSRIVVSDSPGWEHQKVSGRILRHLDAWVEQRGPGQVVPGPVAIVLDQANVVLPDIVYASNANLRNIREGRYYGTLDIVVEVVSPTSKDHDTATKMFLYARAGMTEYWLVDPATRTIQILALVDGIYIPQKANDQGHCASVTLPGLVIEPDSIFGKAASDDV